MRAAVGGTKILRIRKICVLLKVSRELSDVANHLGGKPSSQSVRTSNSAAWLAILRHMYHDILSRHTTPQLYLITAERNNDGPRPLAIQFSGTAYGGLDKGALARN